MNPALLILFGVAAYYLLTQSKGSAGSVAPLVPGIPNSTWASGRVARRVGIRKRRAAAKRARGYRWVPNLDPDVVTPPGTFSWILTRG